MDRTHAWNVILAEVVRSGKRWTTAVLKAAPPNTALGLVLCDFGVARPAGGGGPVQGTHAYMAPEQPC